MNDPSVPTTERERLVPNSLARLETLADRLEKSIEGLRTCFSSVLFSDHGVDATADESPISGSDLGQSLRRVADRIEKSVSTIDVIIDASDV